jgi:hypothetical protein
MFIGLFTSTSFNDTAMITLIINLLKPTGYEMHHQV